MFEDVMDGIEAVVGLEVGVEAFEVVGEDILGC